MALRLYTYWIVSHVVGAGILGGGHYFIISAKSSAPEDVIFTPLVIGGYGLMGRIIGLFPPSTPVLLSHWIKSCKYLNPRKN